MLSKRNSKLKMAISRVSGVAIVVVILIIIGVGA